MKHRSGSIVLLFAVLAFVFTFNLASNAEAKRLLITQKIDPTRLTTLAGNTRPEANAANDRGRVADDFAMSRMLLLLRRPSELQASFRQYLADLQDPASPTFRRWRTAAQLGQEYGPAQQDVNTIEAWLRSQGFTIDTVYDQGDLIAFSGTAGQVSAAFHTEIHQLEVQGEHHIANMSDPQIPDALAPAIVGIVSLNNFMPHPMMVNPKPPAGAVAGGPSPDFTLSSCPSGMFIAPNINCYFIVPADLDTIYNFPLHVTGQMGENQTIVVLEDSNIYSFSDLYNFRTEFNLNNPNGGYAQEHPGPGCLNPGINGADGEATLDVEWAGAAAPGALVVAASCQDVLIFGGFLALQNILQGAGGRPPDVVSISYGEAEVFMGASYNQYVDDLYAAAGAQGISVYVSAGDHGPDVQEYQYGINVSGFASTPDNVAVGGTDFEDSYLNSNGIPYSTYWNTSPTTGPPWGSALRYIPEIPWNSSCASELLNSYLNTDEPALCNLPNYPVLGTLWAGSGGPSECSMGTPQVPGVGSSPGCIGWAQPNFQNNFPGITNNVRDLPDVSLFAAGGPPGGVWGHSYVFCFSDPNNGGSPCTAGAPTGWAYSGGTSFAAPIWAGIQALLNQKINSKSGLPNNILYSLASTPGGLYVTGQCNSNTLAPGGPNPGCIFYDVTSSNPVGGGRLYTDNDVPCQGDPNDNNTLFNCYLPSGFGYTYGVLSNSNSTYMPDYQTTAGWDFATGIGTVNVQNLVNNWPIPPVPINCWPYLC